MSETLALIRYTFDPPVDSGLIGIDPEAVIFEDISDEITGISYTLYGIEHDVIARRTVFTEPAQVQPPNFKGRIRALFEMNKRTIALRFEHEIPEFTPEENAGLQETIVLSEEQPLFALIDIGNPSVDIAALYRLRRTAPSEQ